jgi:hypothetical protein
MIFPKLNNGAFVAADNAGDLKHKMKDYLNFVRHDPRTISVFNPIGNGIEFTCKV